MFMGVILFKIFLNSSLLQHNDSGTALSSYFCFVKNKQGTKFWNI
ncbi:hypothetical protein SAMN04488101_105181 [Pedobacter nyackensis]|uniref:Uncharacterized protein n=1 Tax=Pedobacter nyackensis TaxID=475255 RepID=A0A1W2D2M9_9SPHI|nr:hypothetical protein SAMN04488101_105181 [Pedobacter nyackensis]